MTDVLKYPVDDVAELYTHRWEIELGFREQKQYMLGNRLTLRSKLPHMVRQELWGILLTYNLVRYQMVKMSQYLQGEYYPSELSFNGMLAQIFRLLIGLPYTHSPGSVPRQLKNIYEMAEALILPEGGKEVARES